MKSFLEKCLFKSPNLSGERNHPEHKSSLIFFENNRINSLYIPNFKYTKKRVSNSDAF